MDFDALYRGESPGEGIAPMTTPPWDNRAPSESVIAWQTRGPGKFGARFGGRIWRYELEPVDGGTRVRETWDVTFYAGFKLWQGASCGSIRKSIRVSA